MGDLNFNAEIFKSGNEFFGVGLEFFLAYAFYFFDRLQYGVEIGIIVIVVICACFADGFG